MMSWLMGLPTLQACDMTKLACSWLKSASEMEILHKEPNPVVMPYKGFSDRLILLSRYALQSLMSFLLSSERASLAFLLKMVSICSKVSLWGVI